MACASQWDKVAVVFENTREIVGNSVFTWWPAVVLCVLTLQSGRLVRRLRMYFQ